jgi:hypothetical protein
MAIGRRVLGDEHVDESTEAISERDADFQRWITEATPACPPLTRPSPPPSESWEATAMVEQYGPRRFEDHPPFLYYEDYRSTVKRFPAADLVEIVQTVSELTGAGVSFGRRCRRKPPTSPPTPGRARRRSGSGSSSWARCWTSWVERSPGKLVEIWQPNAAGRYLQHRDDHPAPLDPNFLGLGRCLTDEEGGYRFITVRPGIRGGTTPMPGAPPTSTSPSWGPR